MICVLDSDDQPTTSIYLLLNHLRISYIHTMFGTSTRAQLTYKGLYPKRKLTLTSQVIKTEIRKEENQYIEILS